MQIVRIESMMQCHSTFNDCPSVKSKDIKSCNVITMVQITVPRKTGGGNFLLIGTHWQVQKCEIYTAQTRKKISPAKGL